MKAEGGFGSLRGRFGRFVPRRRKPRDDYIPSEIAISFV